MKNKNKSNSSIRFHASYIVYQNEVAGYKIISGIAFNPDTHERLGKCSIKGKLLDVQVGDEIFAVGDWDEHPVYGKGFFVNAYCKVIPKKAADMLQFLSQGNVNGVTKRLAGLIVSRFQDSTFDVLVGNPKRLEEVKGIGKKTAEKIHASAIDTLGKQEMVSTIMSYIQNFGISPAYAKRIYKYYGMNSMEIIQKNPYKLAEDISGIGFKMADEIALANKMAPDSPMRIESAIQYVLQQGCQDGDVFGYENDVKKDCQTLLDVKESMIDNAIRNLEKRGRIVRDGNAIYLSGLYRAEEGAASKLASLLRYGMQRNFTVSKDEIKEIGEENGVQYAPEQIQAVMEACSSGVMILTGGPGTGKTTTINAIMRVFQKRGMAVLCAAPTGKAAKRMRESTGQQGAVTVHKLLGAVGDPEVGFRFTMNEEEPLTGDVLILDECSMIDTPLFNSILKAVPYSMKVIFVGDVDQLPSVGCGCVFRDLIDSNEIPTVKLRYIYRQGDESLIVKNAHMINEGVIPSFDNQPGADYHFRDVTNMDKEKARDLIVNYVQKYIPQQFGVNPFDIQVLTPMKKGETGVYQLNSYIQDKINPASPDKPQMLVGGSIFRLGDKVMCIRNDYENQVFNGDVGKIVSIRFNDNEEAVNSSENDTNNTFTVDFEESGRSPVTFKFTDLDNFTLAYAMTIHKSQGSEYNYVVLAMADFNPIMMKRNLLYTGVTRAKNLLCLIGTKKAVSFAVNSLSVNSRNTKLKERIKKYCKKDSLQTA